MNKVTTSIYLDSRRKTVKGNYKVRIRITILRESKYYDSGIELTTESFDRIIGTKKTSEEEKRLRLKLYAVKAKADAVIEKMANFTFLRFEQLFYKNAAANDKISTGFDNYIAILQNEKRYGTAESYTTAKNKFEEFMPSLRYADITPILLKKFEDWLLNQKRSISTVGIYTRSLRAIFNNAITDGIIDNSLYPFGKKKYIAPTSKNNKRALSEDCLKKLLTYETLEYSELDRSKDFWLFIYLCNGINMKDMLRLKWSDISDNFFAYIRSKTKLTKRISEPIYVVLKEEAKKVIRKWGVPSDNKDDYIFPYLKGTEPKSEKERNQIKQVTKVINKYLNIIGKELELPFKLTTYVGRHTFATMMIRNGADLPMLKSFLGHSSIITSEKYVSTLPLIDLEKLTDKLVGF